MNHSYSPFVAVEKNQSPGKLWQTYCCLVLLETSLTDMDLEAQGPACNKPFSSNNGSHSMSAPLAAVPPPPPLSTADPIKPV